MYMYCILEITRGNTLVLGGSGRSKCRILKPMVMIARALLAKDVEWILGGTWGARSRTKVSSVYGWKQTPG